MQLSMYESLALTYIGLLDSVDDKLQDIHSIFVTHHLNSDM